MVVSMTGFGRASGQLHSCFVTVEMKSVNHRFLDISLKMPKQFMDIEDKIKKCIAQVVSRGRIEVYINLEGDSIAEKSVQIDWDLLSQYVDSLHQIKERFSLTDEVNLNQIIALGEGINIREESIVTDDLEEELLHIVETASLQLLNMRKAEGVQLAIDLNQGLEKMSDTVIEIRKSAPLVIDLHQQRIKKRVTEFVSGQIDESRIMTEVALFADRVDISEELTRIQSHIHQFKNALDAIEPVGRKLDFLVQELNRETNTIGSKANDKNIAENVVELKSFIEKLKEQVQNIE